MPTLANIASELQTVDKHFDPIILDRQWIVEEDTRITWPSYQTGMFDKGSYRDYFDALITGRQYSYRLTNGAVIQVYYEWSNQQLVKGRCEYAPQYGRDLLVPESILDVAPEDDLIRILTAIRFDYDSKVAGHAKSHMQANGLNDLRIPVDFVLNPYAFFDIIAENLFPSEYEELISKSYYSPAMANYARLRMSSAITRADRLQMTIK